MSVDLQRPGGLAGSEMTEDPDAGHETATAETGYVFPATFAQQRLWFLDRLQPGDTSYSVPWSFRVTGPLDIRALERSLSEIIRRHETLRTTFSLEDGAPVQVIHGHRDLHVPVLDLTGFQDPGSEAKRLAGEEAARAIDLENGPMVRSRLLRLGSEDHVLLFTMHHIAFDGWSRGVFARELRILYGAYKAGEESPLPEPALQYADYAVWQRAHFTDEVLERQTDYWKRQLAGIPAAIGLPTDRQRPAVLDSRGASKFFKIEERLAEKLVNLGRRQNATLYMVMLAGFQALLHRYTGQADIVVGAPIAGRNRRELENVIGLFANTIVFRTIVDGDLSFSELIARTRETALEAYANQDVPFEKLVEALQPERSLSQNPIFQVIFSLQSVPEGIFELSGARMEPLRLSQTGSKFDISLFLAEGKGSLQGRLEYHTDLFDAATIERMIGHYLCLLDGVVQAPGQRVSELPLLNEAERRQLLFDWNATQREYPRDVCLHRLFERQVARTPSRIAVTTGNRSLTYAELNARANQVARDLQQRGAGPGVLVGLRVIRSVDMFVGLLGVLKSGAAYVPLDPNYPPERIALILEDASVKLVITDDDWRRFDVQTNDDPVSDVRSDDLAYVIHTSGSTGRPKGVQITHRNVVNFLCSMQHSPGLAEGDTWLALATFSFDMSVPELYLPLVTGATVLIASREDAMDPNSLLGLMRQHSPNVLQATPATWRMLLDAGWAGDPGLKALIGAEAVPGDLVARLLPRCRELWSMYGPTETTVWSSCSLIRTAPFGTAPLGHPIANTTMYALDPLRQPVPIGIPGELYIGGDGVARGYLNRPDLTAERFFDDPFVPGGRMYRTGDLTRILADGEFQFLGRADLQIKIRGFRIELGEIEARLAEHPSVAQCVVVTSASASGDEHLAAYVVLKDRESLSVSGMRQYLRNHLPEYMLPVSLTCLDAFPLTPTGKIDRKRLPKEESKAQQSRGEDALPEMAKERLEAAFRAHPEVAGAVADVREISGQGAHLFGWILKRGDSLLSVADLQDHLRRTNNGDLPLPVILFVERFPLTPDGKIDRDSLSVPPEISLGPRGVRVGPRDILEIQLTQIWEEVLGVVPIGITDNYFELGGHSIIAVRLFQRIEEVTSRRLHLSLLFKAPTIAEFAAAMREDAGRTTSEALLVPCRTTGSKPPLFAAYGLAGNVLAFWDLARQLEPDRPIYCLEAADPGETIRSLEAAAARYVSEIRALRPMGPYHLTGLSFGGMLIFEIARQLRAAGLEVGLVGLLDTYNMAAARQLSTSRKVRRFVSVSAMRVARHFRRLPEKTLAEWPAYLAGRVVAIGRRGEQMLWRIRYRLGFRTVKSNNTGDAPGLEPQGRPDVVRAYQAMGMYYAPAVYPGRIVLFRATKPSASGVYGTRDLGWSSLAGGGLDIIPITGDHISIIHEPNSRILADEMTKWLFRYEQSRGDGKCQSD